MSTIAGYSKIIALDKGEIAEEGSPQTLISNSNSVMHLLMKDSGIGGQ